MATFCYRCSSFDDDVNVSPDYGSVWQNSDDGMPLVALMTSEEIYREKMSIWKNVGVISLSWMFLFTAYNAVANLQVR